MHPLRILLALVTLSAHAAYGGTLRQYSQDWLIPKPAPQIDSKRITAKSVFITPLIETKVRCGHGYERHNNGKCVKLVHVNTMAQLDFLLNRLNGMYATPTAAGNTDKQPLQVDVDIPTDSTDDEDDDTRPASPTKFDEDTKDTPNNSVSEGDSDVTDVISNESTIAPYEEDPNRGPEENVKDKPINSAVVGIEDEEGISNTSSVVLNATTTLQFVEGTPTTQLPSPERPEEVTKDKPNQSAIEGVKKEQLENNNTNVVSNETSTAFDVGTNTTEEETKNKLNANLVEGNKKELETSNSTKVVLNETTTAQFDVTKKPAEVTENKPTTSVVDGNNDDTTRDPVDEVAVTSPTEPEEDAPNSDHEGISVDDNDAYVDYFETDPFDDEATTTTTQRPASDAPYYFEEEPVKILISIPDEDESETDQHPEEPPKRLVSVHDEVFVREDGGVSSQVVKKDALIKNVSSGHNVSSDIDKQAVASDPNTEETHINLIKIEGTDLNSENQSSNTTDEKDLTDAPSDSEYSTETVVTENKLVYEQNVQGSGDDKTPAEEDEDYESEHSVDNNESSAEFIDSVNVSDDNNAEMSGDQFSITESNVFDNLKDENDFEGSANEQVSANRTTTNSDDVSFLVGSSPIKNNLTNSESEVSNNGANIHNQNSQMSDIDFLNLNFNPFVEASENNYTSDDSNRQSVIDSNPIEKTHKDNVQLVYPQQTTQLQDNVNPSAQNSTNPGSNTNTNGGIEFHPTPLEIYTVNPQHQNPTIAKIPETLTNHKDFQFSPSPPLPVAQNQNFQPQFQLNLHLPPGFVKFPTDLAHNRSPQIPHPDAEVNRVRFPQEEDGRFNGKYSRWGSQFNNNNNNNNNWRFDQSRSQRPEQRHWQERPEVRQPQVTNRRNYWVSNWPVRPGQRIY